MTERRITVEVKNEILGDSLFWEGSARDIARIHNIPARQVAQLVAADGKTRTVGMWHVSAHDGAGIPLDGAIGGNPTNGMN